MWRKIVAGLALFATLTDAAGAAGRVRAAQKILLLEKTSSASAPTSGSCVGGTYVVNGATTVITFTSSGTLNCTTSFPAQVLVVAGGGGGASGGGGAGGYCATGGSPTCGLGTSFAVPSGSSTVSIGAGGAAGTGTNTPPTNGGNGGNSVFSTITASGGGGAGGINGAGLNGGSGGGAGGSGAGAAGIGSQGFNGSTNGGFAVNFPAGSGGGAGAAGSPPVDNASGGNGGAGKSNSITGSAVTYAGGGGGGLFQNTGTGGTGGAGGGGNGGTGAGGTQNGTANTGGGGGGTANHANGGVGGSGIVIISCPTVLCAGTNFNLVFEGDSLTFGLHCSAPTNYPSVVIPQLPSGPAYINNTIATSGISTLTLDQNYATRGGAAFQSASNTLNMLMYQAGTNGSGSTDATALQRYLFNRDYLRKARNTGYQRVLVGDMIAIDADGTGTVWSTINVPLTNFEDAYYNSDMQADGLMQFSTNAAFTPAAAALNTTNYFTDAIHPVAPGCAIMAAVAAPVMTPLLSAPGTRVFAPATWSVFATGTSPGDGTGTVLSNSNRTIGVLTGSGNWSQRAFPGSNSGKFYWEMTVTVQNNAYAGLVNDYFPFNSAVGLGQDVAGNSVGYYPNGAVSFGNATIGTSSTFQTGDVIRYAADFNTKLQWTQRCRSGVCLSWNANGSADPVAEVGGFSFSTMQINGVGDRIYPAGGLQTGTDAITLSLAASQQSFALPTGYSTFAP